MGKKHKDGNGNGKPYALLFQDGKQEIRLYSPSRRTIFNCQQYHFVQFPWVLWAFVPAGAGGYLYGAFATEDISQMSEEEREGVRVYRMPFPAHFDRGDYGPCCLDWSQCYYQPGGEFDAIIKKFWMTEFRGVSDYGQTKFAANYRPEGWEKLSLEDLYKVLAKAPQFYGTTYGQFRQTVASASRGNV